MKQQRFNWSSMPGAKKRLIELWNRTPEISMAEIARILSLELKTEISENAVHGKAFRLRLKDRSPARVASPKRTPSLVAVVVQRDDALMRDKTLARGIHHSPTTKTVFAKRILHDAFDAAVHCGWDMGGEFVCGLRRKPGSRFCETHAAVGSRQAEKERGGPPPASWQNKFVNRDR